MAKLKDFIVKSIIGNTDQNYKMGDSSFDTQDYVFLETFDELKNQDVLDRCVDASDYAIINGVFVEFEVKNSKMFTSYWLRTAYDNNYVYSNGENGEINGDFDYYPSDDNKMWSNVIWKNRNGICPALHLNLSSVISAQKTENKFKIEPVLDEKGKVLYHTIQFGSYPQDKVKKTMAERLEKLFLEYTLNPLTLTGKKYLGFCSIEQKNTQNPEVELYGKKYVRVVSKNSVYDLVNKTGANAPVIETPMWVEVKPIKWVIKNWDELPTELNPNGNGTAETIYVRTEKVLITGIPFNPRCSKIETPEYSMWQNSPIRAFLNGYNLYEELKNGNGNIKFKASKNFNYKGKSFLNEAFDEDVNTELTLKNQHDKNSLSPAEIARNELIKKALERRKQAQQVNNKDDQNENVL